MHRFSRLFPQLVAAASASLVPACAPSLYASPDDAKEARSCDPANALPAALPDGVTYVELRGSSGTKTVIASRGTKCQGVTDIAACEASIAATTCRGQGCDGRIVVWQSGSNVGLLKTPEDVAARYGTIDNEQKALLAGELYASARGKSLKCSADSPKRLGPTEFQLLTVGSRSSGACVSPITTTTTASVLEIDGAAKVATVESESASTTTEGIGACAGRRPEGLREVPVSATCSVGEYFAQAAHLEHASVAAFHVLERELASLGAPRSLLAKARVSAEDERRHHRVMSSLARRYGGVVSPALVEACPSRSVLAIALENVREGCVGETYAALVAEWQSKHASAPKVRAAFTAIARDEAKHASLAWDVHAFLAPLLDSTERAQVEAARLGALAELRIAVTNDPSEALVAIAGLPPAKVARVLLASLEVELHTLAA